MELKLRDGDYVPDGIGGLCRVDGSGALLQRTLFKLTARRGMFPFLEKLGSRLWQLGEVPPGRRQSAAAQYVAEALAEEPVTVEDVTVGPGRDGSAAVTARLRYEGESLPVTVEVLP